MSGASVVFLSWVRQGLAARIATPDPLTTALPAQAPLGVTLALNQVDIAPVNVRLFGPADVLGIDPRQVVRTEPPAGTTDYESNDLAAIEFDNPDLPWLFTPAAADAQGRLRPWLTLAVVRRQAGVRVRPPRTEPLPVLEIGPPASPSAELPDLADSWAWAHAQVATHENASEETLRGVLGSRPELTVSRLLCPRLLAPFTDYIACVVPAFDAGRRAGLGESVDANAPLTPAWTSGADAPGTIALPVYFHWEFRTGAREDFESIVARLGPRDLSGAVGLRPMDIGAPGFAVPGTSSSAEPPLTPDPSPGGRGEILMLEGALQPVDLVRAQFPDEATRPWQQALQSILNAANANALAAQAEPVLGPPIYGRWIAGRHEVGTASPPTWLDELNLDPRERVAAALGTRVVQDAQEDLMAEAWEQAGEMAQANQRLRQMQLSLVIGGRLHARHVMRMTNDDALWRFASPAQARLVVSRAAPGAAVTTMRTMLAASSMPRTITSAPMRRLSRARGAISRRAATAVRIAGVAAPTTKLLTGVSTLFHLYGETPSILVFTLPPTRGLVAFDAVTRRLSSAFAGMTYARATDAAVLAAPRQPDFVIKPEPAPTIGDVRGTVIGGVLDATVAQPARARRRPGDGDVPDIPDLPEPEPPDPIPPRPRPVDNADAKAFREAAGRHLALVNPKQALTFVTTIKRAVLDTAAARPQIQALLDPAPVMHLRMAATIRIAGDAAPPGVGPVGAAPVFAQPMSEPLARLSQDWLLPGLERVPVDTVALLRPNRRFIEAFMLGLNVEMARELLWRDFTVDDPKATFFRRFWRTLDPQAPGDIAPLANWGTHPIGENVAPGAVSRQTVLLVRSILFRRYPGAIVYAVPAVKAGSGRKPGAQVDELQPLFRGALQPDVTFFGFDLDPAVAVGDPGWYFVIQQQPTEPRFGFDVEIDFGTATHVALAAPPAGHALPAGTTWAFNAAHMARILRQLPVRVAIHASELIGS